MTLPCGSYVARAGIDRPEVALPLLAGLTPRWSSESPILPFIERHPDVTYAHLRRWVSDPDEHVGRLVSEGTRPRLFNVLHQPLYLSIVAWAIWAVPATAEACAIVAVLETPACRPRRSRPTRPTASRSAGAVCPTTSPDGSSHWPTPQPTGSLGRSSPSTAASTSSPDASSRGDRTDAARALGRRGEIGGAEGGVEPVAPDHHAGVARGVDIGRELVVLLADVPCSWPRLA
jgi:hypothetical protein